MSEPNHLYHQALTANKKLLEENARLKAEVERLRKAGDEMEEDLLIQVWPWNRKYFPSIKAWRTAKESQPHA